MRINVFTKTIRKGLTPSLPENSQSSEDTIDLFSFSKKCFCCGKKGRVTGFTLIELLVVISIIGLLATSAVIGVNTARAKARDGLRKANADQVKKALELYYNSNSQMYPPSTDMNQFSCLTASSPAGLSTYINPVPTDPIPARDTIALGCPNYRSNALDYKLRVNFELDSDSMVGDGGISGAWYEVYSPGAQGW